VISHIIPLYSVSQKNSPAVFWHFFRNGWEYFNQFSHTYYTFLSTLDYKFLFNYLQLWRSYAILSATTRVLDNAQTAVFTSAKSALYVQILLLVRKQTSRILRGTSDFRVAGVRPLSMTAERHTLHVPQGAGSAASCHDNIITAAGQSAGHPCTT